MTCLRQATDEIFAGLFICGWLITIWLLDSILGVEESPKPKSEVDRLLDSVWEASR